MAGVLGTVSGRVTLDVRKAVAGYAAVRAQNSKMVYALRGTSESFIQSGRAMATAGLGLIAVFGKAVSSAAEFQRRMDFFGAVTNANKKQIRELSKYTLELGSNSIFSVNEIADGFIELGKAGIHTQGIIKGIGKAMVNLAASADIPLADAGQIITSTIKTFNLQATDATRVVNLLQGAANATIADVSDVGVSLKYVGGIAATTGVSLSDTIDAISLLAQAGIRGSTAGTSLRQMLVSLGGATGPATEELTKLGIITKDGTNLFYTQAGAIKPLGQVYQILQDHTKKLNQEQRLAALRTIFNNRALAAASILSRAGAKGFDKMNKAVKATTAQEIASKRLNNLSGDVKKLKANIDILLVRGGSPFQKQARQWVQSLTRLIKAFGNLDPKTQKMIIQTIGMAGAVLLAMGIFNLIIGTILKFVLSMIKMAAGVKFLVNILKILIFNLRWMVTLFGGELAAALGISVGALVAIVAVVLVVVAALVLLYFKWKPFRTLVNEFAKAIWDAIKAVGSFLKLLATDPGAAWGKLKSLAADVAKAIVNAFKGLASKVWGWLKGAASNVGDFIMSVIHWFESLPGKVLGIVTSFVAKVLSYMTFKNLGYVIGFVIGRVILLWIKLQLKIISLTLTLVTKVLSFFAKLPGKIGYLIGFLVGRVIALWLRMQLKIFALTLALITKVVNFFRKLPGRVAAFVTRMVLSALRLFGRMAKAAPKLAAEAVHGTINFFQALPGRVAAFVAKMVAKAIAKFKDLKSKAISFSKGAARGFVDGIKGLPGTVSGILGKVIQAFKDVITQGFNAAKSFAGGLWKGFKKGLGINSPSFIEKHMFQMNDTINKETKKMARQTANIQKLGQRWIASNSGLGSAGRFSDRSGYAGLASMHARNLTRAQQLSGAAGKRGDRRITVKSSGAHDKRHEMKITNWHEGKGWVREIAEDVVDDDNSFDATVERMHR